MHERIIVIGGGVTGVSVAWHLLERGFSSVTLLERDRLGSGTTWHSAGNITWRPAPDTDLPIGYMLELIGRLDEETGQSTGWRRTGRLFVSRTPQTLDVFRSYHAHALEKGVGGKMLNPRQAGEHHPLLAPDAVEGAWLNPCSGRLNPADLVAAFRAGIKRRGGLIEEQCLVRSIEFTNGTVAAVHTESARLEADVVVVAAGIWSREILRQNGIALPQGACEHFYAIADVDPALPRKTPSFICAERLIYGREETGGFLVGFFDRAAKVVDVAQLPEPFTFTLLPEDWDQVASYYQEACEIFPALHGAPIRLLLNGPEAFTIDGRPLVGPVGRIDGLYVASAMNSAGVTYSGMVGHNIADMVTGAAPRFDTFDCAPSRFSPSHCTPEWIDARISDAPSGAYARHHR